MQIDGKIRMQRVNDSIFLEGAAKLIKDMTSKSATRPIKLEQVRKHKNGLDDHVSDKLAFLSKRLEVALEASGFGVWQYDASNRGVVWDARMHELFGIKSPQQGVTYADFRNAVHKDDVRQVEETLARSLESSERQLGNFRITRPDGEVRHIRAYMLTYLQSDGRKIVVGANWDVTKDVLLQEELRAAEKLMREQYDALQAAQQELEHHALHDALTGLPNRRYLERFATEMSARGAEVGQDLACLHIDVDRFKEVNDNFGHTVGDAVLRAVAETLSLLAADTDFVARVGGDEFIIYTRHKHTRRAATSLARKIVKAIAKPLKFGNHIVHIGVSVGIAIQRDEEDALQLVNSADIALYKAKREGRGRSVLLTPALRQNADSLRQLSEQIVRGLEKGEFVPYFQPQVDATTFEITGVEALARWNHPTRGVLAPDQFLSVAEQIGKLAEIDEIILTASLHFRKAWTIAGIPVPKISVNVSAQRLRDPDFLRKIAQLEFTPGTLSFELLESISFEDEDSDLKSSIDGIKAMGIEVEIDDFGTGHASIVSLLELSPKRLKIDRKLIRPLRQGGHQLRLVAAIVDIARTLGIEIIAEGVEAIEQAEILRSLGCQGLQGYAFSRPLSATDLENLARKSSILTPKRVAN